MNQTDLIELLGLGELPPEEQESFLLSFAEVVSRGSLARIIAKMSDAEKDEFAALAERGASEAQMAEFLKTHAPDAAAVVEEVTTGIIRDLEAAIPRGG